MKLMNIDDETAIQSNVGVAFPSRLGSDLMVDGQSNIEMDRNTVWIVAILIILHRVLIVVTFYFIHYFYFTSWIGSGTHVLYINTI
jgi:hypothetical protein